MNKLKEFYCDSREVLLYFSYRTNGSIDFQYPVVYLWQLQEECIEK